MSKQFLYGTDIAAILQQVSSKAVAKGMTSNPLSDLTCSHGRS